MKKLPTSLCIAIALALPVYSQGIPGDSYHPGRPAPELGGATDADQWRIFTSAAPRLIGMTPSQVERAFGKGKWLKPKKTLAYSLPAPQATNRKTGALSCLELTVEFAKGKVARYSVEGIYWAN